MIRFAHLLAERSHQVCGAIAFIMVAIAAGYVTLAVVDRPAAKMLWWVYGIVQVLLALWNLAVYYSKAKLREQRRKARHHATHRTS